MSETDLKMSGTEKMQVTQETHKPRDDHWEPKFNAVYQSSWEFCNLCITDCKESC